MDYFKRATPAIRARRSLPAPESVYIIGNSMGGLVARAMATLPNFRPHSFTHVMTLSSPHTSPPANVEHTLERYVCLLHTAATLWWANYSSPALTPRRYVLIGRIYAATNEFWRHQFDADAGPDDKGLRNVTVVSVTGGNRDVLVTSDLVDVSAIVPHDRSFTAFTTGMPHVWLSVEHEVGHAMRLSAFGSACPYSRLAQRLPLTLCVIQAVLWCKQLVTAVARSLLAVRDPTAPHRPLPVPQRLDALRSILASPAAHALLPAQVQTPGRAVGMGPHDRGCQDDSVTSDDLAA